MDEVIPAIRDSLIAHPRLVLEAPPGAGKTTRVPLALLDAPWLAGKKLLMLEPRRIATRAAAGFMSAQLGETVGATVGYRIRFESRVSAATRIEVVTEGILTRMLQDNPELPDIGAILFDEFHERHLHGDLGAALALETQAMLRPDLRLVIMSATLDGARIASWFDAPRITSAGRSFPVRIEHPPARVNEDWAFQLRRTVEVALADNDGDVLVFLPGKREIERIRGVLDGAPLGSNGSVVKVLALHGELGLDEQQAALRAAPDGERRIVLATNVAESSLTLPGVRVVIDLGQAREPRFDPGSGFSRLETVTISQASADQRAGRAGRVGPGMCYRLWPQSRRLDAARTPEIAQVELAPVLLEMLGWGSENLNWLDGPPAGALGQARDVLARLCALDEHGRISPVGRVLLKFGAHPRLAAAVLRSPPELRALACDLVALVEARNPLRGANSRDDDFRLRHHALEAWRSRVRGSTRDVAADAGQLATIAQAADAWRRRLPIADHASRRSADNASRNAAEPGQTTIGNLLIHAFPDRIARQDPSNPRRYTLANGRGARLLEESTLFGESWLVIVDLRHNERDSLILTAAPFDADQLELEFPQRIRRERMLRWNDVTRAAEAFEEQRFDAIVLERRSVPVVGSDAVPALLAAVRALGLDCLPWSDASRSLRLRVNVLREACPELGLPDWSDAALLDSLEQWLAPILEGQRKLDALSADGLSRALAEQLDYATLRQVNQLAPPSIVVPSGQSRGINYGCEGPPILAVKVQELFGLADTPTIAKGRIPLMLHLLSPAGRPIQVTQDLRSFWERTYPEVRKELKGRYPKHPWPVDPWTAAATHRAKPRGRES
ncbi:MAG: ATP-dependent helicase HrpB [Dokdonella sp.]